MKNNSGSRPVGQQIYTRGRRGIYRSAEGFDTVAKSDSLDHNFVKKVLHPFCLYDAPAELTARGEKDERKYPAALHLFHTDNGETVIGQSVYKTVDFTGLRSAFLTHNFVVPAGRSAEIADRYADWLHADFATAFEGEEGGSLPDLEQVPTRRSGGMQDHAAVLAALGITGDIFKLLIQAAMTAVAGKKKIYISLDVPVSELGPRAVRLMETLMAALPRGHRRRIGFITYAAEPQSRKFIHVTFVEKGALRPGDRNIEKDFVFDLASNRITGGDFGDSSSQPYADLAWKLMDAGQTGMLEEFAAFAEEVLAGEPAERLLSLAAYNELAVYFEVGRGNESLYENNKAAVLEGLLGLLKGEGNVRSREKLNDIFLERFDREFDRIRQKAPLEPVLLEAFRQYYGLEGHHYRGKIVDYFINGMLNASSAGQTGELDAAYRALEQDPGLNRAFLDKIMAQPVFRQMLFEPYVARKLETAKGAASLPRLVLQWAREMPQAFAYARGGGFGREGEHGARSQVQDYLLDALKEKLRQERDVALAAADIREASERAEKERRRGGDVPAAAYALLEEMAGAAERFALDRISLDELTLPQLLELSFVQLPVELREWQPPLDPAARRKAQVLRAVYRWFGEENPDEGVFAGLGHRELDEAQLLGRRLLEESGGLEPFERLPLAYYLSSEREGGPLDYDGLLEFVRRKANGDKEAVYRFFAWSQSNRLFASGPKKLFAGYRRAVLRHFTRHDKEAFKNRDFRKTYAAAARPALKSVYDEAKGQLASPLARMMGSSRFRLMSAGVLLAVSLVAAGLMLFGGGKETAAPEGPDVTAPSAGGPQAVYLYTAPGTGPEAGGEGGREAGGNHAGTAADDDSQDRPGSGPADDADGSNETETDGDGADGGNSGDNSGGQNGTDATVTPEGGESGSGGANAAGGDAEASAPGSGTAAPGDGEPAGGKLWLVFTFADEAEAAAFAPEQIGVQPATGNGVNYRTGAGSGTEMIRFTGAPASPSPGSGDGEEGGQEAATASPEAGGNGSGGTDAEGGDGGADGTDGGAADGEGNAGTAGSGTADDEGAAGNAGATASPAASPAASPGGNGSGNSGSSGGGANGASPGSSFTYRVAVHIPGASFEPGDGIVAGGKELTLVRLPSGYNPLAY